MPASSHPVDRPFLIGVVVLVILGFFIFISASLGLIAQPDIQFGEVILNHFLFGFLGGTAAMTALSFTPYRSWRRYAFPLFAGSLILTALVFVPGIGFEHGGAQRWLLVGPFSMQPVELLKVGYVIYFAAWLSGVKEQITTFRSGLLPFFILLGLVALVLLPQPDNNSFAVILAAGMGMFIVAGARWKQLGIILLIGLLAAMMVIMVRPYVADRITTFLDPTSADPQGSGYQIRQSLIAVGSGGWFGRGFGQSIQKFDFLPEPIGDSIFAVAAEEFGFLGSSVIVLLFLFFAYRGLYIAARAPDAFSRLLVVGIVILITFQSFTNMAAMLGLFPLSGTALIFISQGGTALFMSLVMVGIVLNVSRHMVPKGK